MKKTDATISRNWISISEAAEYIGVSQDTLRRWEKKGKLVPRRTIGKHRRYSKNQLEQVLKQPMEQIIQQKPAPETITKPIQVTQSISTTPPMPPPSLTTQTTPAVSNYQSSNSILTFLNNTKTIIIISVIILFLLIASYLLLTTIRKNSAKEELLSPVPNHTQSLSQ